MFLQSFYFEIYSLKLNQYGLDLVKLTKFGLQLAKRALMDTGEIPVKSLGFTTLLFLYYKYINK